MFLPQDKSYGGRGVLKTRQKAQTGVTYAKPQVIKLRLSALPEMES